MLRTSSLLCRRALASNRNYATAAGSTHALVLLEHTEGVISSGSLSALTAAQKLGGQVSAIVVGSEKHVPKAVETAKSLNGVNSVLYSASSQYAHSIPENLTPLFQNLLSSSSNTFTHVVSSTSSTSKSLLPRISALLDAPTISDVTSVSHDGGSNTTTFTRPIYAGNAISTVTASGDKVPIKFFTVRGTAFAPAAEGSGTAEAKSIDAVDVPNPTTEHIKTTIAKSDRPDLGVASRVVSGGRALKNSETFEKTIYPLADALGAAVGASRAAVDAGYVDNSLQVGQTGKVVAPELYVAVGISGAIQHLAGMKDSKLIVAINKDPDAPIFQVADAGLVADLYDVVPELVEKLKK
ncbi:electron transfer flavoprotein alpha-subunit [Crepidotus variabilis]|uniref:Probable electron transfer flavoprotein subunit alpha n=1 Tax=Crepidotus variabilis TaxID=179855 RepID=A0A9P6EUH9_9AGAR|nr:electron transfer flavoprotein alpha-subunit [Crepidotus variabilis]